MSSNNSSEIQAAFKDAGLSSIDAELLGKCTALVKTFRIKPKELAECWEAYSLNKNVAKLDMASYENFRKHLIKERNINDDRMDVDGAVFTRPKRRTESSAAVITPSSSKRQYSSANRQQQQRDGGDRSLLDRSRVSLSPESPLLDEEEKTKKPAFSERKDAGKVVAAFNPKNLPVPSPQSAGTATTAVARCSVDYERYDTNVEKSYRHMFTTLEERSRQLDAMIQEKQELYSERYDFGSEAFAELEAVGIPRQELVCCIGRICNAAHEGRINATSVMLEGSRHTSNGMRVEVDLTNIKESKQSYSLFPGQIVAIEGINTSGRKLLAQRICEGAAHPPEQTSVHDLLKYHHDAQEGSPLQLLAACGPFTSSDNLEYEPLFEFLVKVKEHQPDVVILMGPFVDMRHKRVSSGRTTLQDEDGNEILVTCEVLFMNKVSILLTDFYNEHPTSRTQFVIVPSMEDATASWVYPQAPFYDHRKGGNTQLKIPGSEGIEVGTLGLKDDVFIANGRTRVHCVSNPCTLRINEVTIGITSSDVLFGLSSEETNANLEPGSRLARLGQHMLQQQSYYPLYPPSSKANLNLKFAERWKIPCGLDFLIVPSMLFPFARSVLANKTIVVNPGLLTKDTVGGSYAIFDVHPIDRSALEGIGEASVKIEHQIVDRTMIEIRKV